MISRLIGKYRPFAGVVFVAAFGLPGAATGLTFDDALSLAQQQAPFFQPAQGEFIQWCVFCRPVDQVVEVGMLHAQLDQLPLG